MKLRFLLAVLSALMVISFTSLDLTIHAQGKVRVAFSAASVPVNIIQIYGPVHYGESFGLKMTRDDFTVFNTGATAAQAVVAGQADILQASTITIMALRQSGQDFKIFCPTVGTTDYLVIGR